MVCAQDFFQANVQKLISIEYINLPVSDVTCQFKCDFFPATNGQHLFICVTHQSWKLL